MMTLTQSSPTGGGGPPAGWWRGTLPNRYASGPCPSTPPLRGAVPLPFPGRIA